MSTEENMNAAVLFIDDDDNLVRLYKKKVGNLGVRIQSEDTVDGALRYLREGGAADVIIWDMSMPPGMEFEKLDTGGGLHTGRYLYTAMIELRPHAKFILLTNRNENIDEYHLPRNGSYAYAKLDTPPVELADIIKDLLASGTEASHGNS
jgi:CheY-like chemotaxis protein